MEQKDSNKNNYNKRFVKITVPGVNIVITYTCRILKFRGSNPFIPM